MTISPGDWALLSRNNSFRFRPHYELVKIDSVTAKQAKSGRRTYRLDDLTRMDSEDAAKSILAKLVSARSEAERREGAAWRAYADNVKKLLGGSTNDQQQ